MKRTAGQRAQGKRPAVLALDGGGSKVDAALVARDGSLIGAARPSRRSDLIPNPS
jgi:hypothetical protein